jgi:hypothetical protein
LSAFGWGPRAAIGQIVDDYPVPAGTVRLSVWPSFTAWDERFAPDGSSDRIPLGAGLSGGSAMSIFPQAERITGELADLSGLPTWSPTTGPVEGRITHDVTRVDLGVRLGLTDRWSVGILVPRIKTRTAVDLLFTPDTVAGDIGVSPYVTARGEVDAFLAALQGAATAATARATSLCGGGDPGCAAATALADQAARLDEGFGWLYGNTPLFPIQGSPVGVALADAVGALDADLQAAGLSGIGPSLPLASGTPSESDLRMLPVLFAPLGYAQPLGSRTELWTWGDIEVSTLLRVIDLEAAPTSGRPWGMDLTVGGLLRLGTGQSAAVDAPLALGSGDGQTDFEGRAGLHVSYGGRLSLDAGLALGIQQSQTVTRRVPSGDDLLALDASLTEVRWDPGDYWVMEAQPGLQLAEGLRLALTYRHARREADVFQVTGAGDAVLLGGVFRRHELGFTLDFDSVTPQRASGARPLRARVRFLRAVAGSGTDVPATTRAEAGLEWFPRLWGDG